MRLGIGNLKNVMELHVNNYNTKLELVFVLDEFVVIQCYRFF